MAASKGGHYYLLPTLLHSLELRGRKSEPTGAIKTWTCHFEIGDVLPWCGFTLPYRLQYTSPYCILILAKLFSLMPTSFLSGELYRIPVPLSNSWPYVDAPWIELAPFFLISSGDHFDSLETSQKLDHCNTTLRFHMNQARWHGRWRESLDEDWKWKLTHPPNGVPELSVVTSGTFIARALYGEFVRYWNVVYIMLTLL